MNLGGRWVGGSQEELKEAVEDEYDQDTLYMWMGISKNK